MELPKEKLQVGWCLIPPQVLCDTKLGMAEKMIIGRIMGLSEKDGYCYASNAWLGKQLGVKKEYVSKIISNLAKKKYLQVHVIRDENNIVTERRIYLSPAQNQTPPPLQVSHTSPTDGLVEYTEEITENLIVDKISEKSLQTGDKIKSFGNNSVNLALEEFKNLLGFEPTDKRPRSEAWNLVRRVGSAAREKNPNVDETGINKALKYYFRWISDQDWSDGIQTMSVVRRKFPVFLADIKQK